MQHWVLLKLLNLSQANVSQQIQALNLHWNSLSLVWQLSCNNSTPTASVVGWGQRSVRFWSSPPVLLNQQRRVFTGWLSNLQYLPFINLIINETLLPVPAWSRLKWELLILPLELNCSRLIPPLLSEKSLKAVQPPVQLPALKAGSSAFVSQENRSYLFWSGNRNKQKG